MIDRRQIVALYARGNATALVTLIRVEGSSYRRAGARLLICADGAYAGSISGGCLEAEVIRKAQWLVRDGATIQRYSTLFDDTADIPFGLGCGGTVDLLIEPAQTPACDALIAAMQASLAGHTQHIETALPTHHSPLERRIHPQPHSHLSPPTSHFEQNPSPLAAQSSKLWQAPFPENSEESNANLIRETLLPPQRLFILGAGDDAQPMAEFAARMGWDVIVADGRAQWAKPERFPGAQSVLTIAPADASVHRIAPEDAVVIMTHSYEQDRDSLTTVLPLQPRYLGLLGARHRSALLVAEAAASLGWDVARACDGLFAPVGLDLGGDGPEAIALATIAEIQARIEGKLGASRRLTAQMVEEQIAKGGASRYLQTQCAL